MAEDDPILAQVENLMDLGKWMLLNVFFFECYHGFMVLNDLSNVTDWNTIFLVFIVAGPATFIQGDAIDEQVRSIRHDINAFDQRRGAADAFSSRAADHQRDL